MNSAFSKTVTDLITPHMDEGRHRALIVPIFSGYSKLYSKIDWSGSAHDFTVRLVELLDTHGEVERGLTALSHLLQGIYNEIGLQDRDIIDKLLAELNQVDIPKLPSRSTVFINRTQEIQ